MDYSTGTVIVKIAKFFCGHLHVFVYIKLKYRRGSRHVDGGVLVCKNSQSLWSWEWAFDFGLKKLYDFIVTLQKEAVFDRLKN